MFHKIAKIASPEWFKKMPLYVCKILAFGKWKIDLSLYRLPLYMLNEIVYSLYSRLNTEDTLENVHIHIERSILYAKNMYPQMKIARKQKIQVLSTIKKRIAFLKKEEANGHSINIEELAELEDFIDFDKNDEYERGASFYRMSGELRQIILENHREEILQRINIVEQCIILHYQSGEWIPDPVYTENYTGNNDELMIFHFLNLCGLQNADINSYGTNLMLEWYRELHFSITKKNPHEHIVFECDEHLYHDNVIKNVNENNENECGICLCVQDSMVKLNCMHMFCSGCITQQVKLTPSVSKCGFCRTSISKIFVLNEETMQHIKTELNL